MNRLFHYVSQGMHAEVELLIDQGSDVNVEVENLTPLDRAVHNNDVRMVELLIKAGADVNHGHPNTGKSVLHDAVTQDLRIMDLHLAAGADVEGCREKDTPLCTAAVFKAREAYDRLIAAGANPRATRGSVAACDEIEARTPLDQSDKLMWQLESQRLKPDRYAQKIKEMMAQYPTVEVYAAHYGRSTFVYGLDQDVFTDPVVGAWAVRLGEILKTPGLLAELEEKHLSGDELEQARRERRRLDRWLAKQARKEARIEKANLGMRD